MAKTARSSGSKGPALEDDISAIAELHRYRERADEMRRQGIESLCRILCDVPKKEEKRHWADGTTEPHDLIQPALLHFAVTREFVATTEAKEHVKQVRGDTRSKLEQAKLGQFFDSGPNPDSCVPIFQAARVLRASLASPETVYSKQATLAYYRVVRELSSVGDGNWIFGGARATEGGVSSAFMTSECARAIKALSRALKSTATVIRSALKLYMDWNRIKNLEHFPYSPSSAYGLPGPDKYMPPKWLEAETTRLALAAYNEIANVAPRAGLLLETADYKQLCKGNIKEFCTIFGKQFQKSAEKASTEIKAALKEINVRDRIDRAKIFGDQVAVARRVLGHVMGQKAVTTALNLAKEAKVAADAMLTFVGTNHTDPPEVPKELETFLDRMRQEADEVRGLLDTTTIYLQSILDREIEREQSGQFNAGELVSAAASYAELEKPELDRRLERATEILCRSIGLDGSFAISTSLDTNSHGYSATVLGSELMRSFAQLLQHNRYELKSDTIKRILSYFERTAVRTSDNDIVGWTGDQPRHPIMASRWTSALAILALDRVTRMLDCRINQRIFRHFTVRRPSDLRKTVKLEDLFYPDYGLSNAKLDPAADYYDGSVANLLERMRSHVLGLAPPPGFDDRCYSLLLYGPPGTGKTQLIESLAASSERHFVEITPSDFLVEGETFIERQARNVFKCLSYLTRTVILFDEFDPMIHSRESDDDGKLNLYKFLTPGMLPKLKLLNDRAKERQVAYCLITNRVGTLDEAATRSGRFDFKVGVFPPDLISRTGRLLLVIDKVCRGDKPITVPTQYFQAEIDAENDELTKHINSKMGVTTWKEDLESPHGFLERLIWVIAATADGGMTLLGKPGNFTPPKKKQAIKDLPSHLVLKSLLDPNGRLYRPGKADANWEERRNGSGPQHEFELKQWVWVRAWDDELTELQSEFQKKAKQNTKDVAEWWSGSFTLIGDAGPTEEAKSSMRQKMGQYYYDPEVAAASKSGAVRPAESMTKSPESPPSNDDQRKS